VSDDLPVAEAFMCRRVTAGIRRSLDARPPARDGTVPPIGVVIYPGVPASWRHPHAVDQDDGLWVSGHWALPGSSCDPCLVIANTSAIVDRPPRPHRWVGSLW